MNSTRKSPRTLRPGTVVTVQMKGLFKIAHHFALVTDKTGDDGLPGVVANAIDLARIQDGATSVRKTAIPKLMGMAINIAMVAVTSVP